MTEEDNKTTNGNGSNAAKWIAICVAIAFGSFGVGREVTLEKNTAMVDDLKSRLDRFDEKFTTVVSNQAVVMATLQDVKNKVTLMETRGR